MGDKGKIGDEAMAVRALDAFVDGGFEALSKEFCSSEALPDNACHELDKAVRDAYRKDEPSPLDTGTQKALTAAGFSEDFANGFVWRGGINVLRERIANIGGICLKKSVLPLIGARREKFDEMVDELENYGSELSIILPEILKALESGPDIQKAYALRLIAAMAPHSKEIAAQVLPFLSHRNAYISDLAGAALAKIGPVDDSLLEPLVRKYQEFRQRTEWSSTDPLSLDRLKDAVVAFGREGAETILERYKAGRISEYDFLCLIGLFGENAAFALPEIYGILSRFSKDSYPGNGNEAHTFFFAVYAIAMIGTAGKEHAEKLLGIVKRIDFQHDPKDYYYEEFRDVELWALAVTGFENPEVMEFLNKAVSPGKSHRFLVRKLMESITGMTYYPLLIWFLKTGLVGRMETASISENLDMTAEQFRGFISDIKELEDVSKVWASGVYTGTYKGKLSRIRHPEFQRTLLDIIQNSPDQDEQLTALIFIRSGLVQMSSHNGPPRERLPESAVPVLIEAASSSPVENIRSVAWEVLWRMGSDAKNALPLLDAMAEENGDPKMVKMASETIEKILNRVL